MRRFETLYRRRLTMKYRRHYHTTHGIYRVFVFIVEYIVCVDEELELK